MKLVYSVLVTAALAACGGKGAPAPAAPESGSGAAMTEPAADQTGDACVAQCVADGGPKDAAGAPLAAAGTAPADLERPCQEQCGTLEPSPSARPGYEE